METLYIPTEGEIKRWVKEAMQEYMAEHLVKQKVGSEQEEGLLNRKEIAKLLRVSLVTLNDWMKGGLPSHKQGGRIYFDKREVLDYIKEKTVMERKFGSRLQQLK